jgi:hypothetical protein
MSMALLCSTCSAKAVKVNTRGQISAWLTGIETGNEGVLRGGVRYIPEFSLRHDMNETTYLGAEAALNALIAPSSRDDETNADLNLYRAQLRYVTAQSETCVGLQKINFGPGRLLRPLRWFDQINPNDPLQLTDGVYGARFKYNTLDNTGLWLWFLYGNEDLKGYELLQTRTGSVEGGGRLQGDLLKGELAASIHVRRVDGAGLRIPYFTESRLGIDGRWDVGIGIWFEAVLQYQQSDFLHFPWTKPMSVGADYTFDIGNGVYVLGEHMATVLSSQALGWKEAVHVSALSMNYPVDPLDQVTATLYYDWYARQWHTNLTWSRTYDKFSIYVTGFWNPDETAQTAQHQNSFALGGKGVRLMAVFNY